MFGILILGVYEMFKNVLLYYFNCNFNSIFNCSRLWWNKEENKTEEPQKEETNNTEADVIKMGFSTMTGANAAGGAMEVEGIQLANELYPTALGKKIDLVIVDNKSDKVEAANAVTRLIEKDKVVAIIGSKEVHYPW